MTATANDNHEPTEASREEDEFLLFLLSLEAAEHQVRLAYNDYYEEADKYAF